MTSPADRVTEADIASFWENGFLLVPGVFTKDTCEALKNDADVAAQGIYTVRIDMHHRPVYNKIHAGPEILSIIDKVEQHRMIPIGSVFFYCKPGNDREAGSVWHQDNYAPKAAMDAYLIAAVPLDDADETNGSLMVMPGTHKLGELPCEPKKNFERDDEGKIVKTYAVGDPCPTPEGYEIKQLQYKAGDLLLLHAHTVHRAEPNPHADRWRRTVYFHYIRDGEPFWPGWNARRQLIERYDHKVA